MRRLLAAGGLCGLTLVLAVLAPWGPTLALDRRVSHLLFHLPQALIAFLDIVWPLGALPVVLVLLGCILFLRPSAAAERWRALAAFVGVGLGELALKHFIATPEPHAPQATLPLLVVVSRMIDINPQLASAWLARLGSLLTGHRLSQRAIASALVLRGTFPSGHVARLTFLTAYLTPRPRRGLLLFIAALTALAVVATGGHWFWDTLGGVTLATGALAANGRLR